MCLYRQGVLKYTFLLGRWGVPQHVAQSQQSHPKLAREPVLKRVKSFARVFGLSIRNHQLPHSKYRLSQCAALTVQSVVRVTTASLLLMY